MEKKNEDGILPAVDEFTRVFSQITQLKIVLYIYDIILDRIDYKR